MTSARMKPCLLYTSVAYMGCRTRVMGNVHDRNREVTCGRGNLSFTSINLPRIGIEAQKDIKRFYQILDERIDLCIEQLLHRFKIQCSKKAYNYPFLMGQGAVSYTHLDVYKRQPNTRWCALMRT